MGERGSNSLGEDMGAYKMMIVDDEMIIATQLEEAMASLGQQVVGTASSGKEAIEMARKYHPDFVLMDIVMPGELDGIDAARILKDERHIPILFVTAYAGQELIHRDDQEEMRRRFSRVLQGDYLPSEYDAISPKEKRWKRRFRKARGSGTA